MEFALTFIVVWVVAYIGITAAMEKYVPLASIRVAAIGLLTMLWWTPVLVVSEGGGAPAPAAVFLLPGQAAVKYSRTWLIIAFLVGVCFAALIELVRRKRRKEKAARTSP